MQFFEVLKQKIVSFKNIFKEIDFGLRFLVGLICLFALTIFIHFREIKVERLDLNSTVNKYIVAQIDFEFPDEEAMIILKQDATENLGPIYVIKEKLIRQFYYDFEQVLIGDSSWRSLLSNISLEQMYKITEYLNKILEESYFTNSVTKRKMKSHGLNVSDYFLISNIKDNKLPINYWQFIRSKIVDKFSNKDAVEFVVQYFEQKPWMLEEDVKTLANVKDVIISSIPQKFSKIKAGTRIISDGETVKSRHIAMMQAMKEGLNRKANKLDIKVVIGNILLAFVFVFLSGLYLRIYQTKVFQSLQRLSLFACIFILTLAVSKITEYILLQNSSNLADAVNFPLLVPFATILTFILFNARLSIYITIVMSIILSMYLAVDHFKFLTINFTASLTILVTTKALRRRKEVFGLCGKCLLTVIPTTLAFNLISKNVWFTGFLDDLGINILFLLITAVLVVGILPVLESLFNVLTDITLTEYMDPNNELLKRLALEMPGTYQHSLVLGNLAEAAAQAVDANGLLCRVSTLYHDIGKLSNPHFFTENQRMGVNIHQLLTPQESAQVIISHVLDGVTLAKKYRLPQSFIDIIIQHHGTMLVYYFYHKELELQGGDKSKVDESKFRYPGPKPHSKEAAIIMIADGVEAASRSLDNPSESDLYNMADNVIKDRAGDGQFNECDLTFQNLEIVKNALVKMLMVTRHVRIKYPEQKGS